VRPVIGRFAEGAVLVFAAHAIGVGRSTDDLSSRDTTRWGCFVGWVHSPAALIWTFRQGGGQMTLTTFHLAPDSGPVATHLLEQLMQQVAG
jgi:hypothetical protein